jgi:hypothetical protein
MRIQVLYWLRDMDIIASRRMYARGYYLNAMSFALLLFSSLSYTSSFLECCGRIENAEEVTSMG